MARGYKNRSSKAGFILHLSKPAREIIRKFLFALLLFVSIFAVITAKSEHAFITSLRIKILDTLTPVMATASLPLELIRNSEESLKTYLFVHSKNAKLEEENKKLRLQVAFLYQVQKENDKLKDLLKYIKEIEYKYITAKVVGNASGPFARSALINAGEDDAILKGQAVIMNGGLVGRIIEVGKNSARILLLTDINSKIPVISMDSRERSVLTGNNNDNPKLIYLPKQSKIADGEMIVTSGDGNIFPPGLMVGRASKLEDGSYEVFPFVSWHSIEYVSILGQKEGD